MHLLVSPVPQDTFHTNADHGGEDQQHPNHLQRPRQLVEEDDLEGLKTGVNG